LGTLFALLGLCACTEFPTISPEFHAGQEDRHYAVAALDGVVDRFVGDGPTGALDDAISGLLSGGLFGRAPKVSSAGPVSVAQSADMPTGDPVTQATPSRSSRFLLSGNALSAGGVVFKTRESREITVGLRADWPSDSLIAPFARAAVGAGRGAYDLPKGAGVFADPIDIAVRTRIAEAEAGLQGRVARDFDGPHGYLTAAASIGLRRTQARLHVTSALLDVRDDTTLTEPFVGVGLSVGVGSRSRPLVELGAQARVYETDRAILALRAGVGF